MNHLGFHTVTLGCKLNRFDSAAIDGELVRRGFRPEEKIEKAAVVVINTCTVTHRADSEARKLIRSIRRRNPRCRLLVTGCYAELAAETLGAIEGVDRVFGNRDKFRIAAILDELRLAAGDPEEAGGPPGLPAGLHFGDRARAFLKVQEGCRLACSYCIVPRVRGASRSVPAEEVQRAALELFRSGYREIVLTGVNTGDWGIDLSPPGDLPALLRRLLAVCGPNRIRLNSLEPLAVTDAVIKLMAADPRLAPHLQVPLQSASEPVLRLMRRNYRLETYRERLERLRAAVPHAGLGADVIVGFPGETEERFQETFDFIAGSPLNYLHVFAWSPRPGTPAAELPGRVHPARIRERSALLRELGERLTYRFHKSFEGRTLDAVALGPDRKGRPRALTGNYIETRLRGPAPVPREIIGVKLLSVTPGETLAGPAPPPAWSQTSGLEPEARSDPSTRGPRRT
jgi:threonylcarbamoyladenosine tRNA methylthiotransferase MtaB